MRKSGIISFFFTLCLSALVAKNVVVLEPIAGAADKYSVEELLRVELTGDSIRFVASDGTVAAQVYKYDYVKLTIADQPEAIENITEQSPKTNAVKVWREGQVYILFGDKAYLINGTEVR